MILRRLPGSRFSEVFPGWTGETVALLGGGPSLTLERVEIARQACQDGRCRAVAVNDAYLLAPWADVLYAADPRWWGWHRDRQELAAFAGERCSIQGTGDATLPAAVHILRNRDHPKHGNGLSLDSQALVTGRNSGFQALNLAILAGAREVILLGIDGKPAADGRTHRHAGHPKPTPAAAYQEYRRAFAEAAPAILAARVHVLNCSPGSAVDAFPMLALEDALCVTV